MLGAVILVQFFSLGRWFVRCNMILIRMLQYGFGSTLLGFFGGGGAGCFVGVFAQICYFSFIFHHSIICLNTPFIELLYIPHKLTAYNSRSTRYARMFVFLHLPRHILGGHPFVIRRGMVPPVHQCHTLHHLSRHISILIVSLHWHVHQRQCFQIRAFQLLALLLSTFLFLNDILGIMLFRIVRHNVRHPSIHNVLDIFHNSGAESLCNFRQTRNFCGAKPFLDGIVKVEHGSLQKPTVDQVFINLFYDGDVIVK
mmetsp:Transcript_6520/g.14399  ORF Transcript_6520/g.14399 Transcript_6520/m.14399 type:complete len:255 (-) Transcript_6520:414-1178(-)